MKNAINIISDKQPETVNVSGCLYAVNTDFKDWINFFILHEDSSISNDQKILKSLNLYKDDIPSDVLSAYKALQGFASCKGLHRNIENNKNTETSKVPVFSYLYDGAYICSDFLRYYGINLQTAKMHWYTFIALFDGLPQDAETKKRIAYRSIKPYEIKSDERRLQIIRIQESIRIPHENVEVAEIGKALW